MQKFLSNDSTILAEMIEKYSVQGWRVAPGTLIGTLSPNRYRPGEMEIVYACIMEKEDEA